MTEVMSRHARLLADRSGEHAAVRDFRKHTGWYLAGFPVGGEVRRRASQACTLDELDSILGELDPDLELPADAIRLPRGHTDGPRPVALPERWLETRDDPDPPDGADEFASGG